MAVSSGWDNGVVTTYTERDGLPSRFISSIREDAEGKLWFNTSEGVAHFVGTKLEGYPLTAEKRLENFFGRRGTEACGSALEETLCVSEPTAPLQP